MITVKVVICPVIFMFLCIFLHTFMFPKALFMIIDISHNAVALTVSGIAHVKPFSTNKYTVYVDAFNKTSKCVS